MDTKGSQPASLAGVMSSIFTKRPRLKNYVVAVKFPKAISGLHTHMYWGTPTYPPPAPTTTIHTHKNFWKDAKIGT